MITTDEIKHLAELARMELSPGEIEGLTGQIDSILGYVGQIKNATGDMVQELPPLRNVMREDVVTNASREYTEDILANTPNREGDYLKVKKILGNSDDII
ncbi:MAG: Asp-tRNA(Asn)/Glu-tRNA(Gln) amidotransferase subunit GatC [Patescibacteria group bacterium]